MALLLQVPGVQGEQPSGPIKLKWRHGEPALERMASAWGAAVVHGSTAYFSSFHNVYSYTVPGNKWTKLPQCKYEHFAMAVINDALTTIGGGSYTWATNTLLSLSGSSWEEVLPPMPTKRVCPAASNTPTHLVVAGGSRSLGQGTVATVEVLNTKTFQWSTANSLPEAVGHPQMTTCGGCIYLARQQDNEVFSCSVEDLLKSTNSSDGGSVWTRLANIPTPKWSTLATLRGRVLAIGGGRGVGYPTGAIHCYDAATNSWSVIGETPTPGYGYLTAVLPSNELVVVGGQGSFHMYTTTKIASCQ